MFAPRPLREAKRRQAVEDGDVDAFNEADKEYQEAQKPPEKEEAEEAHEVPEHVQAFAERNAAWFETDWAMTNDVISATQFYMTQGKTHEQALAQAEKDIKRKYSDRFKNPNKDRAQTVASDSKESRPAVRGYNDLTSEQKEVYAALKNQISLKDYIKELEDQGAFNA